MRGAFGPDASLGQASGRGERAAEKPDDNSCWKNTRTEMKFSCMHAGLPNCTNVWRGRRWFDD